MIRKCKSNSGWRIFQEGTGRLWNDVDECIKNLVDNSKLGNTYINCYQTGRLS